MTEINKSLHTSCKNCAFAEYNGKTQTGCYVNMIEHYKNSESKDVEVIEAYDEEKDFFIINNKFCKKKIVPREGDERTLDELHEFVREKAHLRCDAVVIIPLGSKITDIEKTVKSLKNQKFMPERIILINYTAFPLSAFRQMLNDSPATPWNHEQVLDRFPSEELYEKLIHIGVRKVKSPNFCVFEAGFDVSEDFLKNINDELYERGGQFLFLNPVDECYNGLFIDTRWYKSLGGFREENLIDKVKAQVKEKESLWLMKEASSLE